MKVAREVESVEHIHAQAQAWYESQMAKAERSFGPLWPTFKDWVSDYVRTELRERLIARGWRPRAPR